MLRKIRGSLSIKVFLLVFAVLAICSMSIYCIVLAVLPKQYQFIADRRLENNAEVFLAELKHMEYEEGIKAIYEFCIRNDSAAVLISGEETLSFGEIRSEEFASGTSSIGAAVCFSGSEKQYMLVIASSMQTAGGISNLMVGLLPPVFLVVVLLSVASAVICSKIMVAPIGKISRISKRMASLDMTQRCAVKSRDEIGVLASNLNTMADSLQNAMEQRRNFFAAVSHELKTPLTILKGQIENMILGYGDYQNHMKYLPEALNEAENIEHLVKEIIDISKMENMELRNTLQEVSLFESVTDVTKKLLLLARDKNIEIRKNIETDIVISVNRTLWEKALSNIIGNAVRYSPSGECVSISLRASKDRYALEVENTGVSIPEEDMEHMFVPFYRTDKSRSRSTGGSGLGLYIVKTILDLHHMGYGIKNTQNGVMFFINMGEI